MDLAWVDQGWIDEPPVLESNFYRTLVIAGQFYDRTNMQILRKKERSPKETSSFDVILRGDYEARWITMRHMQESKEGMCYSFEIAPHKICKSI